LFAGGWAIDQLRLFWVAPILGALLEGFVYRWLSPADPAPAEVSGRR
jgi:aquaporin Z